MKTDKYPLLDALARCLVIIFAVWLSALGHLFLVDWSKWHAFPLTITIIFVAGTCGFALGGLFYAFGAAYLDKKQKETK